MMAVPRKDEPADAPPNEGAVGIVDSLHHPAGQLLATSRTAKRSGRRDEDLKMRPDYSYRQSNWQIGRAAEKAGVNVSEFVPGDRFLAWRKRSTSRARAAEKRAMGGKQKTNQRKGKARKRS